MLASSAEVQVAKQQLAAVRDASDSMRERAAEAQERAHDLESQLVDERKSTQSYARDAEARAKLQEAKIVKST